MHPFDKKRNMLPTNKSCPKFHSVCDQSYHQIKAPSCDKDPLVSSSSIPDPKWRRERPPLQPPTPEIMAAIGIVAGVAGPERHGGDGLGYYREMYLAGRGERGQGHGMHYGGYCNGSGLSFTQYSSEKDCNREGQGSGTFGNCWSGDENYMQAKIVWKP